MSGNEQKVVNIGQENVQIIEHLRELRTRLVWSVVAVLAAFFISFAFAGDIYQFLVAPLAEAYGGAEGRRLIFTGLAEAFFTYMKLSLYMAFILAFPIIAWQVYAFVAPGLYKNERGVLLPFLLAAPVLFFLGAAMAYYFIFPLAWQFFLGFEMPANPDGLPIQLEARVSEYLALVMRLIIAFGLAFQLPVVIMLLARAGFATSKGLRKKWKYALVGIVTLAAVITPPDVISQIGLAIPLLLLYELSIYGCKYVEKSNNA